MKSMPASSAILPSARQSGQLAVQRSGALVAVRDDEQFEPNMPILSALALYIARRSFIDPVGASNAISLPPQRAGAYSLSMPDALMTLAHLSRSPR